MSDGLNAAFMRDPRAFMMTNPIDIKGGSELMGAIDEPPPRPLKAMTGIHEFDLEAGERGAIHLRRFSDRAKAASYRSKRIHAYWLPWRSSGAEAIQLGNDADYFFTSALGGCRIQIGAGPNPLVMHISGQLDQPRRQALAQEQMPGYDTSRRFSVTTEYPTSALAFLVGKAYGRGATRRWRFFAQGIGIDQETARLTVTTLHQHDNGVVEV